MGHSQLLWTTCHVAELERSEGTAGICPQCAVSLLWIFGPRGYSDCREQCCCHPVSGGSEVAPLLRAGDPSTHSVPEQESQPSPHFLPLALGVEKPSRLSKAQPLRLELFPAVFPQASAASSLDCSRTWEYLLWKFCTASPRGQKAAYTGPQLNSAAGTEHILLELNLTSRVQQATKQTLKASRQDAFPFPDTEGAQIIRLR